jgi:hypothetical protein
MLVCSVSQLQRRVAIAADLTEAAAALDAPGTGNVVFATLVDDPASVGDHVDAFLGQIMLEAASAAATVTAGLTYAAAIVEAGIAADAVSASAVAAPSVVVEAAIATDASDAAIVPAVTTYTSWNPADKANIALSNGNLTSTCTGSSGAIGVRAGTGKTSGKYYFEVLMTGWSGTSGGVGICTLAKAFDSGGVTTAASAAVSKAAGGTNGSIYVNGASSGKALGSRVNGDVIGVAVDLNAKLIWFRAAPSGNWNGIATENPATGTGGISIGALSGALYPCDLPTNTSDIRTAKFGASAFSGAVPSGFTAGWPA